MKQKRPIVLGIDSATKTGFACSYDIEALSGTHNFNFHPDESLGSRLLAFYDWLESNSWGDRDALLPRPDMIVYEQPHLRGGGSFLTVGLTSCIELFCASEGIYAHGVHTGTLKKFATGSGKATKPEMYEALKNGELACPKVIQDDNHVDALWLMYYGLTHYNTITLAS